MYEIGGDQSTSSNISYYCQTCLSSDRILSPNTEFVDIYSLFSNTPYNVSSRPVYLCWECMAILKKIKHFKAKIEEAQSILNYHFLNKQKSQLKTLSKLTKTYTDNTIIITHNDDEEMKEKINIKQENVQFDDDFIYSENTNNYCLEEIKKENTTQTTDTKIKKNKTTHYKIIFGSNSKKKLRKMFPIQPDETEMWLDRERNSVFFKNFKYKCKMCVHGFNFMEKLKAHMLKHHDETIGPYVCPTCNMSFSTESTLSTHIKTHNFAWECTKCGFQCYSLKHLKAHIKTHSLVQCVYCEAKFQDLTTFYTHYKSLHSIFLCDHCGKRCKTKHMLEKHMSHHLETHICSICDRRYKSKASLRKHYAIKHVDTRPEDSYCVLCDKQYTNVLVYRRHVQNSTAHAQETYRQVKKKFPCPECTNTYSRRAYMMNHFRHVHMNQSKHYCSECDRHFLNRTRFVDHMRYNHEGVKKEKNKLCNICGKGFATNRILMNHIRTHSGERPYECEYCSAKFTQRTSMLSHIKFIHMKNKRKVQWTQ